MADYEKKLEEIQGIVTKLESGDISLEDNMKAVENGLNLIEDCKKYLENAELIINKFENGKETPFEE